jgi:hypothetical protein
MALNMPRLSERAKMAFTHHSLCQLERDDVYGSLAGINQSHSTLGQSAPATADVKTDRSPRRGIGIDWRTLIRGQPNLALQLLLRPWSYRLVAYTDWTDLEAFWFTVISQLQVYALK